MDFLKTLLIYLSLSTALGVQGGPVPAEVPTPTPPPPSYQVTMAPNQTAVPTATPSPSPVPKPTISPNPKYKTVQWGDNGSGVKKVQQRLIELGYLPAGTADGAYGAQTASAVRSFQRANGLSVDGVAGAATQTRLYEDPDVVAYTAPTDVPTMTAPPTITPTPYVERQITEMQTPAPVTSDPGALAELLSGVQADTRPAVTLAGLTRVENGLIVLQSSGSFLTYQEEENGVPVTYMPRLWRNEAGQAVVNLGELVNCMPEWTLTGVDGYGARYLSAAGYSVRLTAENGQIVTYTDGVQAPLAQGDVLAERGELYVTENFLRAALGANTVFDEDEATLLLTVVDKSLATATD